MPNAILWVGIQIFQLEENHKLIAKQETSSFFGGNSFDFLKVSRSLREEYQKVGSNVQPRGLISMVNTCIVHNHSYHKADREHATVRSAAMGVKCSRSM